MKTNLIAFLLSGVCLVSCTSMVEDKPFPGAQSGAAMHEFEINLDCANPGETKALSPYLTAKTYESQINDVQILVFNSSGIIEHYSDCGNKTTGLKVTTSPGTKKVWAVVNGPSCASVYRESDLSSISFSQEAISLDASKGFYMTGSNSINAGVESAVALGLQRFPARVSLMSVKNRLPEGLGSIVVKRAFLTNAQFKQNLSGSGTTPVYVNKMGRSEASPIRETDIINGTTHLATYPDLTFATLDWTIAKRSEKTPSEPVLFYSHVNNSTVSPAWNPSSYAGQKSCLVVVCEIKGTEYYYPIVLDKLERNKCYTVSLSIEGYGSTDPAVTVSRDTYSVTISVNNWVSGGVIEETL